MIKIKRFIALALAALILASLFMTHVVATPSYREFDDSDHGIDDFLTEHQLNICQKNVGQFLEDDEYVSVSNHGSVIRIGRIGETTS